jgi:hypothetical protein
MTNDAYSIDPNAPPPPKVYPRLYQRLRMLKWLALVGGVVMLCGGAYQYRGLVRLKTSGAQTTGKLFESQTVNTGKGRVSYRVVLDYRPTDGATPFRKQFTVTKAVYDDITTTGEAIVTFLPDDPTTSTITGDRGIDPETLAIGVGLLAASAATWWYQRREQRKIDAYIAGA